MFSALKVVVSIIISILFIGVIAMAALTVVGATLATVVVEAVTPIATFFLVLTGFLTSVGIALSLWKKAPPASTPLPSSDLSDKGKTRAGMAIAAMAFGQDARRQ